MSVGSIRDVANLRFGGFYIPVASWFYLFLETGVSEYQYLLLIAIFGAIIWHAIYRSIFGFGGPERNPKKKIAVAGYALALMLTKEPGENPDTVDELFERFFQALTLRSGLRFTVFFGFSIGYFGVALYSLHPLYDLALGSGDLISGGLFLTQLIFILQGQIMGRTATVVPPEKAKWGYVPEFRRIHEHFKDEEKREEEGEFVDFPYILHDIKDTLQELQYRVKGERILRSGEYSESEPDDSGAG